MPWVSGAVCADPGATVARDHGPCCSNCPVLSCPVAAVEARSLKPRCGQALEEGPSRPCSLGWPQASLDPWLRPSSLCLCLHVVSPLCLWLSSPVTGTLVIGLGATLRQRDLISMSLTASAKTLFPSTVPPAGSGHRGLDLHSVATGSPTGPQFVARGGSPSGGSLPAHCPPGRLAPGCRSSALSPEPLTGPRLQARGPLIDARGGTGRRGCRAHGPPMRWSRSSQRDGAVL